MTASLRLRALAALLLFTTLLAACTDDDPESSETAATTAPSAATQAAAGSGQAAAPAQSPPASGSTSGSGANSNSGAQVIDPSAVPQVVQQIRGAVAQIRAGATAQSSPFGGQGTAEGTGSGFVIDQRGYVVTNNHVVTLGTDTPANRLEVSLADGRTAGATLVGRDARTDLAVLKIDLPNLTAVRWADPASIQVGQIAVAMGFPLNLGATPTVTMGVVSATDRVINETLNINGRPYRIDISGAVQTDAAINPGNSGGPLVNLRGEVIGVNTAGLVSAGGQPVQGIFFAVSSQVAQPIVQTLIDEGNVERGYLGIQAATITREIAQANSLPVNEGVAVLTVENGTAAARAGLRPEDIITKIGEQTIANAGDVTRALFRYQPGNTVPVEIVRGGQRQTLDVTLDRRPSDAG